jgi:hypothetical protein
MKKNLFLISLLCLCALHGFAQQGTVQAAAGQKGYLSLSLGGAIPVGEYASRNTHDLQSGVANPGGLLDLSYMYPLEHSPFGLTATLRARFNPIDGKAEAAPFAEAEPDFRWTEKNVSWETAAILVGAYYHCAIAKRLQFKGALLIGPADSRLPKSSILGVSTANPPTEFIQLTTNTVSAVSFSGLAKAGIVYTLGSRWSLLADVGFWYLKTDFGNVTASELDAKGLVVPGLISPSNATVITVNANTYNYTQPMNAIDLSVGIAMRL